MRRRRSFRKFGLDPITAIIATGVFVLIYLQLQVPVSGDVRVLGHRDSSSTPPPSPDGNPPGLDLPSDPRIQFVPLVPPAAPEVIGNTKSIDRTADRTDNGSAPVISVPSTVSGGTGQTFNIDFSISGDAPFQYFVLPPRNVEPGTYVENLGANTVSLEFVPKSGFFGMDKALLLVADVNGFTSYEDVDIFVTGGAPSAPPTLSIVPSSLNFSFPNLPSGQSFQVNTVGGTAQAYQAPVSMRRGESLTGFGPSWTYTPYQYQFGKDYVFVEVVATDGQNDIGVLPIDIAEPNVAHTLRLDSPTGLVLATGNGYGPGTFSNVNFSGVSSGLHDLYIVANDGAGLSAQTSREYYIDHTPPQLTMLTGPDSTSCISGNTEDFSGFALDEYKMASVELIIDGGNPSLLDDPDLFTGAIGEPYDFEVNNFDTTPFPPFGTRANIEFLAKDLGDNTTRYIVSPEIDNLPPFPQNIEINGMILGQDVPYPNTTNRLFLQNDISIRLINVSDFGCAGVNRVGVTLDGDGARVSPTPDTGNNYSFLIDTTGLTDGQYTIEATFEDTLSTDLTMEFPIQWGTPVDLPPTADPQSVTTDEDISIGIILTGSDPESGPITFSTVTLPSNGTLSGAAPNLTYTPNPNYNGNDSLTFKVNDGNSDSNVATVDITIDAVNDAPVAFDLITSTLEDQPKTITLTGDDIETPGSLTFTVKSAPANGSLSSMTGPTITYTPNTNYSNATTPDTFTFEVSDGDKTDIATVSITVQPDNDSPIVDPQTVSTDEDIPLGITLTGSDPELDPITFSVVTPPSNGILSGTAPNLTYTPNANYNGSDSFTFKANDGNSDSNVETVDITINPINDPPVAFDLNTSTLEDQAKTITLTGDDIETPGSLTYTIVTPPNHGNLSGTAPNLTYTPNTGFSSPPVDTFTFEVSDGNEVSNVATVSITVGSTNGEPTADAQTVNTDEDIPLGITLTGSDPELDPITFSVVTPPSNGILSGTAPNLTYTPNANYNGSDSFTFKANDGNSDSNVETVDITINPINDPPVAFDLNTSTLEDQAKTITLTGDDIETPGSLTYTIVTPPNHGNLSGTAPNLTYTPNTGFSSPPVDTFTFEVSDGNEVSNVATVSITVGSTNGEPTADAQTVNTDEDVAAGITLTGLDPEGDPLTYIVLAQPSNGSLSGTAPHLTYTPRTNFNGTDGFTFKVNDGILDSPPEIVTINVNPINDAPQIIPFNVALVMNVPYSFDLKASDVETPAANLIYTITNQPTNGTLSTGSGMNRTYTPNTDFVGSDGFDFNVSDGDLSSADYHVDVFVGDGQNPTMINLTPSNGSTVSGQVAINMEAIDNNGILKFILDIRDQDGNLVGGPPGSHTATLTASSNQAGWVWDTGKSVIPNGIYSLSVVAEDRDGNMSNPLVHQITVSNASSPLPDVKILAPQSNKYYTRKINLMAEVSNINQISFDRIEFKIDGVLLTQFNTVNPTGIYQFEYDTLGLVSDGQKTLDVLAYAVNGDVGSSQLTFWVDNTAPTMKYINPDPADGTPILFGPQVIRVRGFDNLPNSFYGIEFEMAGINLGFVTPPLPGDDMLLQIDTSIFADGTYSLFGFPEDLAGNRSSRSFNLALEINNTNPPASNLEVQVHPVPNEFVVFDTDSEIYVQMMGNNIPDLDSITADTIRVTYRKNGTVHTLKGRTLPFDGSLRRVIFHPDAVIPQNAIYTVTYNFKDQQGKGLIDQWEFRRAMQKATGGDVYINDVASKTEFRLVIPPDCLPEDLYIDIQKKSPSDLPAAIVAVNNFSGSLDAKLLAGPYDTVGERADGSRVENLSCPGEAFFIENGPPTGLELGREVDIQAWTDTKWSRLGTSGKNSAATVKAPVQARTVRVPFVKLTYFQVTSFTVPNEGIAGFINYPSPFSPHKPNKNGELGALIQYSLWADADVKILIYDLFGNLVRKLNYSAGSNGGQVAQNQITWDGRNGEGIIVANGGYILQIIAKDQNGNVYKARQKVGVLK